MNDIEVVIDLTAYQAEVLRLISEKSGKTEEEVIVNFFTNEVHCT